MTREAMLPAVMAVEAHGWSLFVLEDDGSHAWFSTDVYSEKEMKRFIKIADATVADVAARFPQFVLRAVHDYGTSDDPAIGCVYIDIYSQAEAEDRGLRTTPPPVGPSAAADQAKEGTADGN